MNRAGTSNEEYLEKAMDIFVLLLRTRESGNPIFASEIELQTGIDTRTVADMVRAFQKQGFPIISGQGYKWAKTRFEFLRHLVKERRRFVTGLANVSKAAKRYQELKHPTLFDQSK